MCGIWLLKDVDNICSKDVFYKLKHRGPDCSTLRTIGDLSFGIHRLAINGTTEKSNQPFFYQGAYCVCNGEIYNFEKLAQEYNIQLESGSDCEILLPLYKLLGPEFVTKLIGEFAFIIVDNGEIIAFRDHFGKRPLFWQISANGRFICISSEMKSMYEHTEIHVFPPRHYIKIDRDGRYKEYEYYSLASIDTNNNVLKLDTNVSNDNLYCPFPRHFYEELRQIMRENIEMMTKSDKKIGALLSGGLDSSIIVYELARILPYRMNTYSIGLPGGTDEKYARMMAEFAGTNHTHIYLTEDEMRAAIPEIVYTTESYDITTIRASIGQYLICKHVREKILFVGEGPDEFASGYKYFMNAPSPTEMHAENVERMENIHLYDGLRMDRCPAKYGIEVRAPFMIHTFVEKYLSIDPIIRMPHKNLTKCILRELYRDDLPREIVERPKEAFSDGMTVGLARPIFEILRRDDPIVEREYNSPTTSEASYYRLLWEKHFSNPRVIKSYWMPKWTDVNDPSALKIEFHNI